MTRDNPERDDLDQLLARQPAPPPMDVGGRARVRARALLAARRLTLLALLDLGLLVLLGSLAYLLGNAIAASDLPALLRLVLEDFALARSLRGELLDALLAALPWRRLLAVAASASLAAGLTWYLLRATVHLPPAAARTRR